jgi:uncharacterized protein YceH (UPF0502 family)
LAKSTFIRERFSRPSDEARVRIAKLEREVVALKRHLDETQGRVSVEIFLLNI